MAAALRVYQLGAQGYWSDEVEVIRRASLSFAGVLADTARAAPLDGPGSYLITHLQLALSADEAWLRFQAVVWSLVGVLGAYGLAWRLSRSTRTALLASFLVSIAAFDIRYAQELRYYSAVSALHLWSWFFLVGWLRHRTRVDFIGYVGSMVVLIGTATLYGGLVLLVQVAYLAVVMARDKSGARLLILAGPAVVAAALVPWFALMTYLRLSSSHPVAIHGDVRFVWTLDLPFRTASWLLANSEPLSPLAAVLLTAAAVGLLATAVRGQWWALGLVVLAAAEFGILALGAYVLGTNLAFRRALFLLPLLLLPAARGLESLGSAVAIRIAKARPSGRLPSLGSWLTVALVAALSIQPVADRASSEKPAYREAVAMAAADTQRPLVVIGPADDGIYRVVAFYAKRADVTAVAFPQFVRSLGRDQWPSEWSPGRPVVWLTVVPITRSDFVGSALNDIQRTAVLAGDAGYPSFRLAAYLGQFAIPETLCDLDAQAQAIAEATLSSDFPALRVWRSAATSGLEILRQSRCA